MRSGQVVRLLLHASPTGTVGDGPSSPQLMSPARPANAFVYETLVRHADQIPGCLRDSPRSIPPRYQTFGHINRLWQCSVRVRPPSGAVIVPDRAHRDAERHEWPKHAARLSLSLLLWQIPVRSTPLFRPGQTIRGSIQLLTASQENDVECHQRAHGHRAA